jgi:hypothetical protein
MRDLVDLPSPLKRRGKHAAKKIDKNDLNRVPLAIPRGAADPTSITGKRGGRPLGALNKKLTSIRDALKASDSKGVTLINQILDMNVPDLPGVPSALPIDATEPQPDQYSVKDIISLRELQLKALAMAWSYRHGRPKEMSDPNAADASQFHPIGPNGSHTIGVAVIKVGGGKDDYIHSLKTLNAAMAGTDNASSSAPDTDDTE